MVHNGNSAPSYDTKLNLAHPLKRRILVAKKPSYGSQMCHFIGKVTVGSTTAAAPLGKSGRSNINKLTTPLIRSCLKVLGSNRQA
jgi:hypothetical protein